MKATIFARKGKTRKGVEFYSYFTKLTKKDGTEETFTVKIREEDRPKPEYCMEITGILQHIDGLKKKTTIKLLFQEN